LGVPTIVDRVAQMIVRLNFEPRVEPIFCEDSYGYRPKRSATDAVGITRQRCWKMPWLIEFDIIGLFDNIDHELMMKLVRRHTDNKWIILYIERFLCAPILMPTGIVQERKSGTPQGGVISPVLANLYMHYAFDQWMERQKPRNPWARYADDGVIHCWTKTEAEQLLNELKSRMRTCELEIHPDKTKIVYCKSDRYQGRHENEDDTGKIDSDYMNSRFEKFLKIIRQDDVDEVEMRKTLDDLHKSFAMLTQEEQKYTNIFLHDVESGNVRMESGKTFRDYITEYQSKAKNDQIHRISRFLGMDERKLRNLMASNVSKASINEFGRFDDLKASVDKAKAQEYF
jgi:group II intron reverse transcriptase/maturase